MHKVFEAVRALTNDTFLSRTRRVLVLFTAILP